jgi:colanic acid/amylovoran biosynthesis glycosyltransferase
MTRVAYLINQYPKISHTFIRREILAVEQCGIEVVRIAMRGHETGSLDTGDASEASKTRYLLQARPLEIAGACLRALARSPGRFFSTLATALRLGARSDGGLLKHLAYFTEACLLRAWLSRTDVSHVHAHFGTNAAAVAMLCRRLGGPTYSFTVHGPDEFDRVTQMALREKIADAKFVAAISSFCRSQLYRWARLSDWDKIEIVRCALDSSYFEGPRPPVTDTPKLVCIGRLSEEKGQMLVLRAADLLHRRGIKLEVVLAGDGPLRKPLEAEIDRLDLRSVVRITGWIDNAEVRSLLEGARALVVASFAEGLPVVIMEAFALGRPVISTMIAGVPELVEDGLSGWLVPAGDLEALTDAMQRAVAADTARLAEMGEHGRKRTLERHSSPVEAAKLGRLFSSAPVSSTD